MSQISKLNYVDSKLGAPTAGQQTTRILFNTIVNPAGATSLVFFKSFQNLTSGQTNLVQNKLDSGESMICKSIFLMAFDNDAQKRLTLFGGNSGQTISVLVGNQTVVKDLPLQFNQGLTGQAFDRLHSNAGFVFDNILFAKQNVMPVEIRLLTDIVIPPQVSFEVRVEGDTLGYGNIAAVCALAGYGKIFSAGMSF